MSDQTEARNAAAKAAAEANPNDEYLAEVAETVRAQEAEKAKRAKRNS